MTGFVTKKLRHGKGRALGSILKAARTKANVSLEEAEVQTRIRLKYLQALEDGQYHLLPAEAYNVGFVRCYASWLKLNPEKIIRLYREERSSQRLTHASGEVSFTPVKLQDWHFLITPKVLGILGAVLLFGGVISYIAMQLNHFTAPPEINLTNAPEEFTSERDSVSLSGVVSEGSVVVMNNEPVLVTPEGEFTQDIQLSPGVNEVVIAAKSRAGKESQKSVKILFNPNLAKAEGTL